MRRLAVLSALILLAGSPVDAIPGYSHGPRQIGEIVLDELLTGTNRFVAVTGSGGCTSKNSFRVDVRKEGGITAISPHYVFTIQRVVPDECKAIVEAGTPIFYDIEKDFGIRGDFTYSVANRLYSSPRIDPSEESLWSVLDRHFSFSSHGVRETAPDPYRTFAMDHDYFRCRVPADWKLERDREGDEIAGIFEIRLTKPGTAKPDGSEISILPPPLIYAGFYRSDNDQGKSFESFLADYEKLARDRQGSGKSKYEKPKDMKFLGRDAREYAYEVYREIPRGPLFAEKYWLKARFIVFKAEDGFFVLAFKSAAESYDLYSPVFEEVAKSFVAGTPNDR